MVYIENPRLTRVVAFVFPSISETVGMLVVHIEGSTSFTSDSREVINNLRVELDNAELVLERGPDHLLADTYSLEGMRVLVAKNMKSLQTSKGCTQWCGGNQSKNHYDRKG
jgi:hypothetical protein